MQSKPSISVDTWFFKNSKKIVYDHHCNFFYDGKITEQSLVWKGGEDDWTPLKNIPEIFDLLSVSERKQVFYLLILILFMALLDVIGVASIMPFIGVLTNSFIEGSRKISK